MEIDKEAFNNLKDKVEVQEFRISDLEDAIDGLRNEISNLEEDLEERIVNLES